MKRFLLLFIFCVLVGEAFCAVKNIMLKTGETYYIYTSYIGYSYFTPAENLFTHSGEATAVEYYSRTALRIHGVKPGYSYISFMNSGGSDYLYVFHVFDVIPNDIELIAGNTYTYTPLFVGEGNTGIKSFTWTSSDESIARVDASGCVTAISPGKATITASPEFNSYGTGASEIKSVVTVSTQPAQELKLNKKSQELEVGKSARLTATISPDNTTNKAVKWLSSNENIAQVDDNGNVTAIGAGYCSIYAKADDGSGKFDKCLIHVNGPATARGDINGDGAVNLSDAKMVVDIFVGNE